MPRTVVPSQPARTTRGPADTLVTEGGDDLPTKLVKYVPAETLAFFVPVSAAIGTGRDVLVIVVTIAGAIGTLGWLWYNGSAQPPEKRPLLHFYVLSVVAFLVWAVAAAPNLASLVRLDAVTTGVVLAVGVFLIPLADGVLERLTRKT